MGFKRVSFGSLQVNGEALDVWEADATQYMRGYDEGDTVTIGDSVQGKTITWVQPDGIPLLIADRPLMNNISWEDLNNLGLAEGKIITIDGEQYFCRLLDVGDRRGAVNEWDACLDAAETEANDVWHWKQCMFLGGKHLTNGSNVFPFRGYSSARFYYNVEPETRAQALGYRPVLEPINDNKKYIASNMHNLQSLEGQYFSIVQAPTPRAPSVAFRPMLYPKMMTGILFDTAAFQNVPPGTEVRMFTMLMNGEPVQQYSRTCAKYIEGARLALTDKFYGLEYLISWKIQKNAAIATKNILRAVRVEDLIRQGYMPEEQLE